MRTKGRKFLPLLLLSLILTAACMPTVALAKSNEDVTAEITAEVSKDKTSAEVTVHLQNTGNEPVSKVRIQGVLPEGLSLEEGDTLTKEEETLAPGSETALQYTVKAAKTQDNGGSQDSGDREESNQNGGDKNPSPNPDQNDNGGNPSKGGDKTTTPSSEDADAVDTGDSANPVIFIVVCMAAAGVILIVCIRKKKGKGLLSLLLVAALVGPYVIGVLPVKAADSRQGGLQVAADVVLGDKSYTLTADISYSLPETVAPSGAVLTRAQWIDELLAAVNAPETEVVYDNETLPFTDIDSHAKKNQILLAYANQLLPEMGTEFRPDAPADREFAAYTAVKALGFQPVKDIACADAAAITYKQEVETAVAMELFQLTDEAFRPAEELTQAEADAALSKVREIANVETPEENTGEVVYDEDAIIIPEDAEYTMDGTTITFTSGGDMITEGSIFILPDQTPYKAVTVQKTDGAVVVETSEPDIQETLDEITASGTATADMSGFIPAEGVTFTEAAPAMAKAARVNVVDVEGSLAAPGKVNFKIHKKIGKGELYGNVAINLPKIKYKADVDLGWGGFNIKDVYLKFPLTIEATGGYEVKKDGGSYVPDDYIPNGGLLELGKLPIAGIPGVTIYAQIGIKYEISGKIEVVCNIDGETGVQVLNNRLRKVDSLEADVDFKALAGSAKIGPSLSGLLEVCKRWDLIDFGVSAGPEASGELLIRNTELMCIDANVFLYGELSALDEGVIGDWLDIGYTWEFWKKENSPLKANWHFENFSRVDHCTYEEETGKIVGRVADAADRNTSITGATITAYQGDSTTAAGSTQAGQDGGFELSLPAGDYKIKVTAAGYQSFECDVTVEKDKENYTEVLLMIDEQYEGVTGSARGRITNAVTGEGIHGATLTLRRGWNKTSGDVVATTETNEYGDYRIEMASGNYTATIERDGYVTVTKNIVVFPMDLGMQNASMNPNGEDLEAANLRVVLTWGETPSDLDSHLLGPTADGSDYFHIYYGNKRHNEDSVRIADLDVDDITSYGPETTSLYQKNESGTYSFYVHDYSNGGNSESTAMSQSGAIVEVYLDGQLYKTYPVPTGKTGVNWHVFDYDAATNTITDVNQFTEDITYQPNANARMAAIPVPMDETK